MTSIACSNKYKRVWVVIPCALTLGCGTDGPESGSSVDGGPMEGVSDVGGDYCQGMLECCFGCSASFNVARGLFEDNFDGALEAYCFARTVDFPSCEQPATIPAVCEDFARRILECFDDVPPGLTGGMICRDGLHGQHVAHCGGPGLSCDEILSCTISNAPFGIQFELGIGTERMGRLEACQTRTFDAPGNFYLTFEASSSRRLSVSTAFERLSSTVTVHVFDPGAERPILGFLQLMLPTRAGDPWVIEDLPTGELVFEVKRLQETVPTTFELCP